MAAHAALCFRIHIPCQYLAVQDQRLRDLRECLREFREAVRHIVAAAREQRDAPGLRRIAAVQLATDAIKLVLNVCQR